MKMLAISVYDPSKTAEISKVSDKVLPNTPGYKPLAMYVCLGNPFPGEIPPNSAVTVAIIEAENENALAAVHYPLALAGVSIHRVPILEVKPGKSVETEKKLKG